MLLLLLIAACFAKPMIVGHRGDPTLAPENTMPSFKSAVAAGVQGVETDLVRDSLFSHVKTLTIISD